MIKRIIYKDYVIARIEGELTFWHRKKRLPAPHAFNNVYEVINFIDKWLA